MFIHLPLCLEPSARPQLARGLTPPRLNPNNHYERALAQLRSKEKPLERYIFMQQLKDADLDLFYRLTMDHMSVSLDDANPSPKYTQTNMCESILGNRACALHPDRW